MERLGPFALGPAAQQGLRVVANYQEPADLRLGDRTLASWSVEDATGAVLFQQIVDPERQPEEFADLNVIQRATVLYGAQRRFLFVEISYLPSAPGGGAFYYVFGLDRQGKFREMAKLIQDGKGVLNRPDAAGRIPLAEGRYLDLAVWTSWFEMTFRYAYDGGREALVPRKRCSAVAGAVFSREYLQELIARRDNVVPVYARPEDRTPRERIAVTPAHKIELLQACAGAPPRQGHVDEEKVVLQIRINGKGGWVRPADFHRLGIQQAG